MLDVGCGFVGWVVQLPGITRRQCTPASAPPGFRAHLLERIEGVGGQHLGPLVAVVAGRVAAREDVGEGAQEAVLERTEGGAFGWAEDVNFK